jgi:hypothetical protein
MHDIVDDIICAQLFLMHKPFAKNKVIFFDKHFIS